MSPSGGGVRLVSMQCPGHKNGGGAQCNVCSGGDKFYLINKVLSLCSHSLHFSYSLFVLWFVVCVNVSTAREINERTQDIVTLSTSVS